MPFKYEDLKEGDLVRYTEEDGCCHKCDKEYEVVDLHGEWVAKPDCHETYGDWTHPIGREDQFDLVSRAGPW